MDFLKVTEINLFTEEVDKSKWRRCFIDLEGSLTSATGNILQLAAITTDWNFNILDVYCQYYLNDKPIGAKELSIHKITEEFLKANTNVHFTEVAELTPLTTVNPTMFISLTTFDITRIQEEMRAYGKSEFDFGEERFSLATDMTGGNCYYNAARDSKQSGVMLAKHLGPELIDSVYRELKRFGKFEQKSNHDALYDTVLILALCRRFVNERTTGAVDGRAK